MTKTIIAAVIVVGGTIAAGVYGHFQEKRQAKKEAEKKAETTKNTLKTKKEVIKEKAEQIFDAPYFAWKKLSPELRSLICKTFNSLSIYCMGMISQVPAIKYLTRKAEAYKRGQVYYGDLAMSTLSAVNKNLGIELTTDDLWPFLKGKKYCNQAQKVEQYNDAVLKATTKKLEEIGKVLHENHILQSA